LACAAEFAVEHVNEIKFNPDAFESLVLPKAQKKIVKALVESHTGNRGSRVGIDDVIKGKGKGLVAVLQYASFFNSFFFLSLLLILVFGVARSTVRSNTFAVDVQGWGKP